MSGPYGDNRYNYDAPTGPLEAHAKMYLDDPPAWPMYSYARPGSILWNAVAGRLSELGWTDDEIGEHLRSKATRTALDCDLGTTLMEVGYRYAEDVHAEERMGVPGPAGLSVVRMVALAVAQSVGGGDIAQAAESRKAEPPVAVDAEHQGDRVRFKVQTADGVIHHCTVLVRLDAVED